MKDFSKATPRPWWASGESSSNGAYKIEDADGWHVAWIKEKKDVHLIVTAVNNFDKMKEALLKASKLLQAAAIEAQRPEVEKYLSGGYRQTLENAVFKDSLGIEQLLESLK